ADAAGRARRIAAARVRRASPRAALADAGVAGPTDAPLRVACAVDGTRTMQTRTVGIGLLLLLLLLLLRGHAADDQADGEARGACSRGVAARPSPRLLVGCKEQACQEYRDQEPNILNVLPTSHYSLRTNQRDRGAGYFHALKATG